MGRVRIGPEWEQSLAGYCSNVNLRDQLLNYRDHLVLKNFDIKRRYLI